MLLSEAAKFTISVFPWTPKTKSMTKKTKSMSPIAPYRFLVYKVKICVSVGSRDGSFRVGRRSCDLHPVASGPCNDRVLLKTHVAYVAILIGSLMIFFTSPQHLFR